VKLSVVGGSVSFGTTFTTSRSKSLFHWKIYQWLNATFPDVLHEHYCGAVPASGPSYMEHCLHWHVEAESDLVLLEYAVNFEPGADDIQSFERMLRKLLRMPKQPAIIIVNTMELMPPNVHSLHFSGEKAFLDGYSSGPASAEDMSFLYPSPPEDEITQLALYYGVPTVSLRSALFHELKSGSPRFPVKEVFHDRHHPGAWGHSLMAQMVVDMVSSQVDRVSDVAGSRRCDEAIREAAAREDIYGLGPPLISKTEESSVGMCIKGESIMDRVFSTKGFAYKVEGNDAKMKPGLIGTNVGDQVQLCLDVRRLALGQSFVVILGHLISYEHMGAVSVRCLGECGCPPDEVDAHVEGGKFSVFKAKTIALKRVNGTLPAAAAAKPGCNCLLELVILPKSGSGEHKFKVLSLMSAEHEGSLRYGHQTGFNVRPMKARVS